MSEHLLFVSGHVTDSPDRRPPRFPEEQVAGVRDQIATWFSGHGVGPGWTLLTGGARGADLLAAEEALRLGANVRLCLALDEQEFLQRSVRAGAPSDQAWEDAFARVRDQATIEQVPHRQRDEVTNDSVFAQANDWMLDRLQQAPSAYALLVWDGGSGQEGGTGEVATRAHKIVRAKGGWIHIIDPTPRAYEERQDRPGPKRVLALNGGGLRGVISLEILASIEDQLRAELRKPDLVLADYFDYIAGTSTGAIIATGLALGKSIEDIRTRYHQLGKQAFRRSPSALRYLSRFGVSGITDQLKDFLGDDDMTLGDPRLRTLLLLVLHRIDTDSPWLLSNCTRGKYNQTSRLLTSGGSDRNLDLPLLKLIRGSTAAPTYFPPEKIDVGKLEISCQDGGVTAFNNPALIAAVMATLPAYKLEWPIGAQNLLVVSIGTGLRAQVSRRRTPRPLASLGNLGRLPSVMMNGGAFSQDLLCRVIGDCRFGPPLDREVGDLTGQLFEPTGGIAEPAGQPVSDQAGIPAIGHYFSYVRYDADLSPDELANMGIPKRDWSAVTRLDDSGQVDNWKKIGAYAARSVDVAKHFAGFLALT